MLKNRHAVLYRIGYFISLKIYQQNVIWCNTNNYYVIGICKTVFNVSNFKNLSEINSIMWNFQLKSDCRICRHKLATPYHIIIYEVIIISVQEQNIVAHFDKATSKAAYCEVSHLKRFFPRINVRIFCAHMLCFCRPDLVTYDV